MSEKHDSTTSIRLGYTNVFLTECNDGYILIDTSYTDQYSHFRTELQSLGINLDQIKCVLLTHHHDDHAGFVRPLIHDTGAKLIAHENALPNLEKGVHYMDMHYLNTCTKITLTLFSLIREHTYPGYTLKEDDIMI
jgi:glyoxylase-like metal-dependent hydrolase (beta-lactamase superfamily II)